MEDLTNWVTREAQNMGIDFSCLNPQTRNQIISILMSGLENGFRSRMDSPDLRFAKRRGIGKGNQTTAKQVSQDGSNNHEPLALDGSCSYSTGCTNGLSACTNSGCTNSGLSGCTNNGSGAIACMDISCNNTVFCHDNSDCKDENCLNGGWGANQGCTDNNNCSDGISPLQGCTNQANKCTDNGNCIDGMSCKNNSYDCIDNNNCSDSVGCSNIAGSIGTLGCVDNDSCSDGQCNNNPKIGSCIDYGNPSSHLICIDSKCSNMNDWGKNCTDESGCKDTTCCNRYCQDTSDSGCIDSVCCNGRRCEDGSQCHDSGCVNSTPNTSAGGCHDNTCFDYGCNNYVHCEDNQNSCTVGACRFEDRTSAMMSNEDEDIELLSTGTVINTPKPTCADLTACDITCTFQPCTDNGCVHASNMCLDDTPCSDTGGCKNQGNCLDQGTSANKCTDDDCNNEGNANCVDYGDCLDSSCYNTGEGLCTDAENCSNSNCTNDECVFSSTAAGCNAAHDNNCTNTQCANLVNRTTVYNDSNCVDYINGHHACADVNIPANCMDYKCDP